PCAASTRTTCHRQPLLPRLQPPRPATWPRRHRRRNLRLGRLVPGLILLDPFKVGTVLLQLLEDRLAGLIRGPAQPGCRLHRDLTRRQTTKKPRRLPGHHIKPNPVGTTSSRRQALPRQLRIHTPPL